MKTSFLTGLLQASAESAIAMSTLFATTALAQAPATAPAEAVAEEDVIIVTGTILRRNNIDTPSPVTVVSAASLDQRAQSSVQEAIQSIASNNGPALTNSFSANGAFAGGASAVSLRGLSTSSTLVLFDGLRAAYYPLADDGTRNFVDLNTIPDDVIDRVEVLRDGASSSYGADAIAGVVNIITKRQYVGVGGRAEAGISERGDAGNQRLSLIAGHGDVDTDGFNVYVAGFYNHSAALYNRDRPYPYNSDDLRNLCFEGNCGPNNVVNGRDENGAFPDNGFNTALATFFVRPYDATNTSAQGRNVLLNPTAGCRAGTAYNPTADELALDNNGSVPTTVCQEDISNLYGVIAPEISRFGGTARGTVAIGDNAEAYMQFNFMQSDVSYTGIPSIIRGNAAPPFFFPRYSTSAPSVAYGNSVLTLPVYVCPRGTVTCDASNGTLNPNNPFAASNQVARLSGRLGDSLEYDQTRSRVYRAAAGITGKAFGDWDYSVDLTAMHNDLKHVYKGYVYIQHLLDVIADGSYNFVNPQLNSQAVRDYLTPVNINNSSSDLFQGQFSIGRSVADLPGGPLQVGFGGAIRYEAVDAPSANSDFNGPTERYFRINGFGVKGNRTVYSAYGEVNAPVLDSLEINASGRYDKYSSGPSNFSPKIGAKFTPVRQISVRGTYSRGFRIPSFGEANATFPTTGFVGNSASTFNDAYLAQYGCTVATFDDCPQYISTGSYGSTNISNPDLQPEKSRSFTAGVIVKPLPNLTFSVDYYNIKKTGAITTASVTPALQAYYAGQPIPAGFTVIPDGVDPDFVDATPRVAFVQAPFINANTVKSEGLDFAAYLTLPIGNELKLTSSLEASYIIELSTTFPDGSTEQYAGTLGNFNLTSGSGTPRWHGSWQNTLDFQDRYSLSTTINYFDSYTLSAEDQFGPGTSGDCSGFDIDYTPCRVRRYVTVDMVGSVKINDRFTFYVNVLNLLDDLPPVDPVTYGAHLYNPVQGGTGIIGRAFRAGVKVGL